MSENTFPILKGYDLSEILYEGEKSRVYRGVRQNDNCPVVIKLLKSAHPSHTELLEFRHQYNLLHKLDIKGIVSPLALETWQEKLALIMPDNGSVDLLQFQNQKPLELDIFLGIAIQLSSILEQLHQQDITHKDIKPSNIIIQPKTREIALIDFSIASQLSSETQSLKHPDTLAGTLNYLSPEQTGRMNRGVDYRSDFYSLGVTFYQLLSGQLPFKSHDPLELVHSHLAREPKALEDINVLIPVILSKVVQKLMAKNAEDRYQSAIGLQTDLKRCEQQYQQTKSIQSFTLAQGDIAKHFLIPEKLYGRLGEVKSLLSAFDRASNGQKEAVLISGLSGIGKTALVNEVHKPMTYHKGYFIKGKFDLLKRDTPFSALSQALCMLISQLLDENNEQRQQWREQISNAIGEQGQLLIELVPELEQLIGTQPAVEDLQGAAAAHRFHHLMRQFFQVFTTQEHPLILFLDDLQWIDSATLQLLPILLNTQNTRDDQQYLLFIGAYRDNEIPPGHPLLHTLNTIMDNGLPISSLILGPLKQSDLNQLVADACHCNPENTTSLSQVIYQKTLGNPFFTHHFLQQANEEGLLNYDFDQEHWLYDLNQIQQLATSVDVVDFIAAKLRRLDQKTQHILQLAACIGTRFDLFTLALIAETSPRACARDCMEAIQKKLLLPIGEDYKLFSGVQNTSSVNDRGLQIQYRFAHDRIQQAAYSLIPENKKAKTHLSIGRLLKQEKQINVEAHDNSNWLFDVVNQFNAGMHLIHSADERIELVEMNYLAGKKARLATAYDAASQYIQSGLELLQPKNSPNSWNMHYALTLGLFEESIEVSFLLGNHEKQQAQAKILLNQSKSLTDRIKTHQLHCLALIAQSNPLSAIEYALPILNQCGIIFPTQPTPEDFQKELQTTKTLLADRDIASLISLPRMTDTTILAGVRLLEKLDVALYIATPALFPLAVFKRIQLAIKYGNAPEVVPFYGAYGYILSGVDNDIESGYEFGLLSLALLEKFQAWTQKAVTYANIYVPRFYKKAVRDSIFLLQEASQSGLEFGDLHYAASDSMFASVYSYFASDELTDLEKTLTESDQFISRIHQNVCLDWNQMLHQVVLNLIGGSISAMRLQGKLYNEDLSLQKHQKDGDRYAIGVLHTHQAMLAYLFDDNNRALEATDKVWDYLDALTGIIYVPVIHFYDSLIRLAVYPEKTKEEQSIILEKVSNNQEKMYFWAQHAPMNFQHKWALVEAERYRIQGDFLKAEDYYDEAIEEAAQNKYLQEEALACELSGRFFLNRKKHRIAKTYLKEAYYTYARWGAKAKTEQLETLYNNLLDLKNEQRKGMVSDKSLITSSRTATTSMDLDCVMKCSQSLSSELSLAGLLDKILTVVTENAGAQHTALLLVDTPNENIPNKKEAISTEAIHWSVAAC